MKKKLYETPQLVTVTVRAEDILLASGGALTEDGELDLSGNTLIFRKDGSVNIWN